jgi:hypothetical protein
MKFSLRQLAIMVLLVALVLGLVVSSQHIRSLEARNEELRAAAGFNLPLGAENVYTLRQVGFESEPGSPIYGSWLLRVDHYKDYNLEISHFAPNKPVRTDKCELYEPLMAVSFVPSTLKKYFLVQPTRVIGKSDFRFEVDVPDQVWPNSVTTPDWPEISDRPILYFMFSEPNSEGGPEANEPNESLMARNPQAMTDLCNRHNVHMVVLRLVKRDI